jgi:hypothetical protein
MNPNDVLQSLQAIATSDHFVHEAYQLTEKWETEPDSDKAVDPILSFLEEHPDVDVGSPGPLVHFVEKFYRHGYEAKLLDSLHRKPVAHTVWMLNRIINGAKDPVQKQPYVKAMSEVKDHPLADAIAREQASHYLDRIKQLENE